MQSWYFVEMSLSLSPWSHYVAGFPLGALVFSHTATPASVETTSSVAQHPPGCRQGILLTRFLKTHQRKGGLRLFLLSRIAGRGETGRLVR